MLGTQRLSVRSWQEDCKILVRSAHHIDLLLAPKIARAIFEGTAEGGSEVVCNHIYRHCVERQRL
ncbi:hypothetical protein OH77DRAFT_846869 [Trametes cingulata]|nr:hypothetical protein OH77DRAFT_846869 [Trametes cingulata]